MNSLHSTSSTIYQAEADHKTEFLQAKQNLLQLMQEVDSEESENSE